MRLATIIDLLCPCCPSAISRFVIAVIINAINRKPFGPNSHINKKVSEIRPSLTNCNPASAVIGVAWIERIKASLENAFPRSVSWTVIGTRGMTVFRTESNYSFDFEATAGLNFFRPQIIVASDDSGSACAFTNRAEFSVSDRTIRDNFKSSKCFTDQRDFSRHGIGSFSALFSGGRPASTGARYDYPQLTA